MFDLKELGITAEELQNRVVERIADQMLTTPTTDEDGNEFRHASAFSKAIEKAITERIDKAVEAIGDRHVKPHLEAYIEAVRFQTTNGYGEPKAEPMTFREYLVKKAESYFTEEVDHEGKSRNQNRYGSWSADGTRVAWLIEKHLKYSIENYMKSALKEANGKIVQGIEATVKMKLEEIAKALKVEVKT